VRGILGSSEQSPGVWALRTAELPGGRFELVALISGHHPDGAVVGPGPDRAGFQGAIELLTVRLDGFRRPVVEIAPWATPEAPGLWFVEADASTPDRSMHSLVAFGTEHHANGTIIPNAAFFTLPVRSDQQLAALRWDTTTGEIDQIYVAPDVRDRGVAKKMVIVGGAYHAHRGWEGKIHVGGRRSDTVEEMLVGRSPLRVTPRTERTVIIDPLTGELAE